MNYFMRITFHQLDDNTISCETVSLHRLRKMNLRYKK